MKTSLLIGMAFFVGLGLGLLQPRLRHLPAGDSEPRAHESSDLVQKPQEETLSLPQNGKLALGKALASLPVPGKRGGNGFISGTVNTEEGKPLAQVLVHAARNTEEANPKGRGVKDTLDLEAKILDLVNQHHRLQATSFEGRTDEEGLFRLAGLEMGSYSVQASLKGYRIEPAPGEDSRDVQTESTIRFVARIEVAVPVSVLLPGGQQAPSANIQCVRKSPSWSSFRRNWFAAEPELILEPGWYELTALHGKNEELRSEPLETGIRSGVPSSPIALQLEARPGIRGRVIFPEEEEVGYIKVFALRWTSRKPPGYKDFLAGGKSAHARQGEGFAYSFQDLPPGTYALGTGRSHDEVELVEEVQLRDKLVQKDLILPNLDPAEYVVLWVFGPGKETLTDVTIQTACHTRNRTSSSDSSPMRRPDGSFWVVHYRAEGFPADDPTLRFSITVTSYQYGSRALEYSLPVESPLVIEFEEPAFLEVQIAGYEGSGFEGWVDVGLVRKQDEKGPRSHQGPLQHEIDLRGRKKFGPLEPGPYELSLSLATSVSLGGRSAMGISSIPVTLHPGNNIQTIQMPSLHSLTVITDGMEPADQIHLMQLAPDGSGYGYAGVQPNRVGTEGRITFERIPAGTYKLSTWGSGKVGEMVVRIPESSQVRYEPKPVDAMYLYVSDPSGYLARAGFRTGDLIVGLDGTLFQEQAQMDAVLRGAAIKEEVQVRVLRDGREIDLRFAPRLQRNYDELGGRMWPSSR